MNNKKLQALAEELAKDLKTPEDLNALSAQLTKLTVEAALKAEMNHHLGYVKNAPEGHHSGNSRNGYSVKTSKVTTAKSTCTPRVTVMPASSLS